jgi:hypothetical protein
MGSTLATLVAHDRGAKLRQSFPGCFRWLIVNGMLEAAFLGLRVEVDGKHFELVELSNRHAILRANNHSKGIRHEIHLQSGIVFCASKLAKAMTLMLFVTPEVGDCRVGESALEFKRDVSDKLNSRSFRRIARMVTDPHRDLFALCYNDDFQLEVHNSMGYIAQVPVQTQYFALGGSGRLATLCPSTKKLTVWEQQEHQEQLDEDTADFQRYEEITVQPSIVRGLVSGQLKFTGSEFDIQIEMDNQEPLLQWNWWLAPIDWGKGEKDENNLKGLWMSPEGQSYKYHVAEDQGGVVLVNSDTQEQELELRVDTDNQILANVCGCYELANRLVVLKHHKPNGSQIAFIT